MRSAICDAATHNDVDTMQTLFAAGEQPPLDDCLWLAAGSGQLESSRMLLEKGAAVDRRGNIGRTPLMRSVHPSFDRSRYPGGPTGPHYNLPLVRLWAVGKEQVHVEMAALLLEFGADPDARDYKNRTVVDKARADGSPALVDLLEKNRR